MPARRRRTVALTLAASCLLAVSVTAALIIARPPRRHTAGTTVALSTAVVTRTDLVSREQYHGQLSYGSRETVHPGGFGTITSLPHVGQTLARGSVAWSVDDQPVGVLWGATPLFRTLAGRNSADATLAVQSAQAGLLAAQATLPPAGGSDRGGSRATRAARSALALVDVAQSRLRLDDARNALRRIEAPQEGPDVALVSANMSALGYAEGSTDVWTPELQAAVTHWQQRLGSTTAGVISPSDVLVVAGAERVGAVVGGVGDPTSAVSVALTSPDRVATFTIRGGVPSALAVGRRVRLSAAGRSVVARVRSVSDGAGAATVVVTFDQSSPLAALTSTQVSMSVTTSDRRGVLVVPVQSLVALASGGYALQLPGGRLLAVRVGTEQDEQIEVSGAGIHAGLRVVSVK